MHRIRLSFLRWAPLGLAACLVACGGGGDEPLAATPDAPQAQAAGPESEATGRAEALAFTMSTLPPAPPGISGNVSCTNWRIGAITLDNVEVPAGASCRLDGTRVLGSVQVQPGGVLIAAGVQVSGSVQGDAAGHIQLTGATSRIAGNVELEGGGTTALADVRVAGDVFVNGLSDVMLLRRLVVGGNMQVTDNLGGGEITGNRITGNLQCTGNLPAPLASGNTAASIESQCLPGGGVTPPPPLSGNVTCVGLTIGAIRLDSVSVPAGASCTLLGTLLNGNLEVGANARLVAESVNITGGVTADGAAELTVRGASLVGGSMQVQRAALVNLVGTSITGDLQLDNMTGPIAASNNRVTGNLQAMANRGGVTLLNNRMGGVMQCKDNLPAPTGSGNVASLKEDQCVGL